MLNQFYCSNACLLDISANVIEFDPVGSTGSEKSRRQRRDLNAIIGDDFKLTTTPVPGLRKAKDYFYEA